MIDLIIHSGTWACLLQRRLVKVGFIMLTFGYSSPLLSPPVVSLSFCLYHSLSLPCLLSFSLFLYSCSNLYSFGAFWLWKRQNTQMPFPSVLHLFPIEQKKKKKLDFVRDHTNMLYVHTQVQALPVSQNQPQWVLSADVLCTAYHANERSGPSTSISYSNRRAFSQCVQKKRERKSSNRLTVQHIKEGSTPQSVQFIAILWTVSWVFNTWLTYIHTSARSDYFCQGSSQNFPWNCGAAQQLAVQLDPYEPAVWSVL